MTRRMYTFLLTIVAPLIWIWMSWKGRHTKGAWQVFHPERFGYSRHDRFASTPTRPVVWVHAVSVGETRASAPLIEALLRKGVRVVLTHTTPTGRDTGAELFRRAISAGQIRQAWMPYDFPGACLRFMMVYSPVLGVLIEREVWPNAVAVARRQSIKLSLVSARLSASGLQRSARMGRLLRNAYAELDVVCAQTAEDAERLISLGCRNVSVCGNLKFDVQLDLDMTAIGRQWKQSMQRPTILLASTRQAEHVAFAKALAKRDLGDVLVIWVPRHPQYFDEVANLLYTNELPFERRSVLKGRRPDRDTKVVLGDSMGEMAYYYGASSIVLMGGTFAPLGGQNFIEACAAGLRVLVGPSLYNFKHAADEAMARGLVIRVPDIDHALELALSTVRNDPYEMEVGSDTPEWIASNRGTTARIVEKISVYINA